MDILIIVKPIALAYEGEGSTQAQGKIALRAAPNYAGLDPSVRFFPVNISDNASSERERNSLQDDSSRCF